MGRFNNGIWIPNNLDPVPTDAQGGYAGGDSTAAQVLQAGSAALAAIATMENLKVSATQLTATSWPTISISGAVPTRTINIGIPAGKNGKDGDPGRDGMGYAEGQQLVADSTAAKESASQSLTLAQQAQKAALEVPDNNVSALLSNPTTATRQAMDAGYTNRTRTPLMLLDYAAGDGVTNDTAGVQAALAAAAAQGRALYSPPAAKYLVDPITIGTAVRIEGHLKLTARTAGQASVLTVGANYVDLAGLLTIDGAYKASVGLLVSNGGRSNLGRVSVEKCLTWGVRVAPTGNNNHLVTDRLVARSCGKRYTSMGVTQTAVTANVNTSITGYSTLALATPLDAPHTSLDAVQWVIYNNRAHKVRTVTATELTVFNLDLTGVSSPAITVVAGGALAIHKYGDSGVGTWQALDLLSNPGVGVLCSSLYGHTFNNLVSQGNAIGFAVDDYSLSLTMIKPYFELNDIDLAVWAYLEGTVEDPVLTVDSAHVQFVQGIVTKVAKVPRLIIRKGGATEGGHVADLPPSANPGARTITVGQTYSYHRSSGSWAFTLASNGRDSLGQYVTVLALSHGNATAAIPCTITPSGAGETIEGAASWTGPLTGKSLVILARVDNDWKVTVVRDRAPSTAITAAPVFVGQTAVVSGVAYMATGTSAAGDWKQIS